MAKDIIDNSTRYTLSVQRTHTYPLNQLILSIPVRYKIKYWLDVGIRNHVRFRVIKLKKCSVI